MREGLSFILLLIIVSSILDTITQLFLKSAINSLQIPVYANFARIIRFIRELIRLPQVWVALLFSVLALCTWLWVLSKADLNLAFSIGSVHYIFIAFSSKFLLREKVGFKRWLGTFFIVIGIVLVAVS
ncbi:MAG: EamA family transporter [Candidatus Omnitrophota bacterium]|nr:EamA family transporter [Candidatus Omnitrophota bacterium]